MEHFPRFTTLTIPRVIQKDLARKSIELDHFKDPSIFMSMFNDIEWKRMMRIASRMPSKSRIIRTCFYQDIGLFWVQVRKRRLYGNSFNGQIVQQFRETGRPIFTATSALSHGRSTIDFNGEFMNTELLFQTFSESSQYLRGC